MQERTEKGQRTEKWEMAIEKRERGDVKENRERGNGKRTEKGEMTRDD